MNRCMGCMEEYDAMLGACPNCGYRNGTGKTEPYYLDPETILNGRYIVGKALSDDSFGITYIAWDCVDECKTVIKEYLPRDFATRQLGQLEVIPYDGQKQKEFELGLTNFLNTSTSLVEMSGQLDGVVKAKCNFIENSTGYYVMEYLDGIDLSVVLKNSRMEWQDVIQIIEPVLRSLHIIHGNKIINYNISPENIMMTRDRTVKLRGFEASKFYGEERKKSQKNIKSGFSAYELYQSDMAVEPSADVYSIAAVIYYAITGVIIPSAVDRYDKDTVVPPSKLGIKIPKNVENAIMNALNVEHKYRTKSCREFLEQLYSNAPVARVIEPKRKSDTGKFGKKTKIIIASATVVAVALIAGIVLMLTNVFNPFASNAKEFPDLINCTQEEAQALLKKIGMDEFDYEIIGTLRVEGAKEGTIVWQGIEPGTKITDFDEKVQIKMAEIENTSTNNVPNLEFKTEEEAREELNKLGFNNYEFYTMEKEGYAAGVVCAMEPNAGTEITQNDLIKIFLAKGTETEPTTETRETHKQTQPISRATQPTTKAPTQPVTKATAQPATEAKQPPAEAPTQPPAQEKVAVPNIVGSSQTEAVNAIKGAGLKYSIAQGSTSAAKAGTVQSVSHSGLVDKGTVVTITVYQEPPTNMQ